MTELNTVTDPYLPEPKGVAVANDGQVYAADGAASGDWSYAYHSGWEYVADTGGSQSLTNGSWVDLSNDGVTANNTTYLIPGMNQVWDTTNDQFDWTNAGLSIGDTVDIRLDFDVTTASANDAVALRLDMAEGGSSPFSLEFFRQEYGVAGTYHIIRWYGLFIGSSDVLDNMTKIACWTDGTGNTIVFNSIYARVSPRKVKFSTS